LRRTKGDWIQKTHFACSTLRRASADDLLGLNLLRRFANRIGRSDLLRKLFGQLDRDFTDVGIASANQHAILSGWNVNHPDECTPSIGTADIYAIITRNCLVANNRSPRDACLSAFGNMPFSTTA
jgi:hypothetical protein